MADTVLTELKIHEFDSVEQMSQYESEIGENDIVYTPDQSLKGTLFDFKWADHVLNDISWLRADTFSWHSGDVYVTAYEHLSGDLEGAELKTETVAGIEIQYYKAKDKHKICLPDQESNLSALYESTGVAWYYLLDTANKQFKLPRTKWGFTGLRDGVGGYVAPALPDHNHVVTMNRTKKSGTDTATVWSYNENSQGTGTVTTTNASASNAIYGASDTVQQPATQMYLYFWVGAFDQTATEQTAGLNAELFNGKADRNLLNTTDNVDIVIETQLPTADNGHTWYRKYKSGWVEQGGVTTALSTTATTITLPVEMAHNSYYANANYSGATATSSPYSVWVDGVTTTSIRVRGTNSSGVDGAKWYVCGMAA